MTVRYHHRAGQLSPDYVCQKLSVEDAHPICQDVSGGVVDEAVGQLLLQSVSPLALEVSLQVQQELQSRLAEADRLRRQQVERVQYEADQARMRFMRVDPNNRLVADTLEGLWNEKLRNLAQAKEEYEKKRQTDQQPVTPEQQQQILALTQDVPKLWNTSIQRQVLKGHRVVIRNRCANHEQETARPWTMTFAGADANRVSSASKMVSPLRTKNASSRCGRAITSAPPVPAADDSRLKTTRIPKGDSLP
jgi:hypothetical protein